MELRGATVYFVLAVLVGGLRGRVQAQGLQCPDANRPFTNCCPCGGSNPEPRSLQCTNHCPEGFYSENSQLCETTTTASITTTFTSTNITTTNTTGTTTVPSTTNALNTSSEPESTSPTPTPLIRCLPCHATCKRCGGGSLDDCLECPADHKHQANSGTPGRCVKPESSRRNIGGIVGGVVASVVGVVVVVVVVVIQYRRRRRRMQMDEGVQSPVGMLMGPAKSAEEGGQTNKGTKEPEYVNISSSKVNPESIERGHDNVLRYVRDPTVKGQGQSSKPKDNPSKHRSEMEELADLPVAPARPSPAAAPPEDEYEIVGTPQEAEQSKGHAPPVEEEYEITDLPSPTSRVARSQTALVKTGHRHGQTGRSNPQVLSLPNPSAPISCPDLSTAPSKHGKAKSAVSQKKNSLRQKVGLPASHAVPEEPTNKGDSDPEDDYVNFGGADTGSAGSAGKAAVGADTAKNKTGFSKPQHLDDADVSDPEDYINIGVREEPDGKEKPDTKTQSTTPAINLPTTQHSEGNDHSDPEEDYENIRTSAHLVTTSRPSPGQGIDNPAADLQDEPEVSYGNIIDENPYQNVPFPPKS